MSEFLEAGIDFERANAARMSDDAEQMRALCRAYEGSATPAVLRDRAEILHALDGLDVVPPGLVDVTDWPDAGDDRDTCVYGVAARVPSR